MPEAAEEALAGAIRTHVEWFFEDDDMARLFSPAPPDTGVVSVQRSRRVLGRSRSPSRSAAGPRPVRHVAASRRHGVKCGFATIPGARAEAHAPTVKCHGEGEDIAVGTLRAALRRLGIHPKDFFD